MFDKKYRWSSLNVQSLFQLWYVRGFAGRTFQVTQSVLLWQLSDKIADDPLSITSIVSSHYIGAKDKMLKEAAISVRRGAHPCFSLSHRFESFIV